MKNKTTILSGSVIASAILAVSGSNVTAASLTSFNTLGSGAEVRSGLLGNPADAINAYELNCAAKTDAKTKEASCGEHKKAETKTEGKAKEASCGEHKKAETKTDGKAKDAKCGESKCGEHKKAETKTEGKAKDAKCGEGKCGEKKADPKSPK
jgi:uncharacterized low-complexity protein